VAPSTGTAPDAAGSCPAIRSDVAIIQLIPMSGLFETSGMGIIYLSRW
jgi:hypothetical protein